MGNTSSYDAAAATPFYNINEKKVSRHRQQLFVHYVDVLDGVAKPIT